MSKEETRWFSTKEVGFGHKTFLLGIGIVLEGPTLAVFIGRRLFIIGPHKPKDKQDEASKQG
jgi:hypothetical protein